MKLFFNKARPKHGIKNYHVADNFNKEPYYKIQKIAFAKHDKPKDHFLDAHCKIHGPKPAPGKYKTEYKWDELLMKSYKTRGHFYKQPKITFTQSVMDESKRDYRKAAPNTYFKDGQGLICIGGNIKRATSNASTSEKSCAHIDDAKWHGQQTGFGFKYNISYKVPDPNERMAKIWKESDKARMNDNRIDSIKRDKSKPAPGDYDCSKAFKLTRNSIPNYSQSKSPKVTFTEIYRNNKKFVPAPGHYKVDPKVYNKLGTSPSLKSKRH